MSFVHPGFLWFLSLLSIPIIIHLFHFRRYKKLYFPTLKFLQQIEQEKKSTRKLKEWVILALRLLAIFFLVIAFSQPTFKSSNSTSKNGIPVIAIYLDNSMSMSAKGAEGELFSEGRESARRMITKCASNSRILLCTNELSGNERKLHTKATAIQALDAIKYGSTTRTLNQILQWQSEFLERMNQEEIRIGKIERILLSDFQSSMFSLENFHPLNNDRYHVVQVKAQNKGNLFIDTMWMDSPVHRLGQQCQVFFSVVNESDKPIENCEINIKLGSQRRMAVVNVAGSSKTESYVYFTPEKEGYNEGVIQIADRHVTWDDNFYFTSYIANSGNVFILNGKDAQNEISKVFSVEPFYKVKEFDEFHFNQKDLANVDLLILNGINELSSGLAANIQDFSKNGGTIYVIPGNKISLPEYNNFLSYYGIPKILNTIENGTGLSEIDYKNSFFKGMFDKEKKQLNLPLIKRAYAIRNLGQSNSEKLLNMRNDLPLFLKSTTNGNLFLLNTSLHTDFGSMAENAIFPALSLRIAELSLHTLPSYFILGKSPGFQVENNEISESPLSLKREGFSFIPNQIEIDGGTKIQLAGIEALQNINEGIYDVVGEKTLARVALNLNRKESKMKTQTEDEIKTSFANAGIPSINYSELKNGSSHHEIDLDHNLSYWRIFVIIALLSLLGEMAILKFWR